MHAEREEISTEKSIFTKEMDFHRLSKLYSQILVYKQENNSSDIFSFLYLER